MNHKSIKRIIALCLFLAGMAGILTAFASIDDHQGVGTILDEVILQGPHPIPADDPMYSAEFSRNCHRVLYTRTFTCACHGKASDIITKYFPHSSEWHYSSSEHCDLGCCTECGQSLRRNHVHNYRQVSYTIVSPRLTVYNLKCACGKTWKREVYK